MFIVRLGGNKEGHFEVFLVIVERSLVQVTFVDTEGNERVQDVLYQPFVNVLAIPMALDKAQDGASEF